MGQVIGTVNVQVGSTQNPKVSTLSYGSRSLKSATDLSLEGATDGDVVVYQANTKTFKLESASAVTPNLDAGTF